MSTAICPACGRANPDSHRFCSQCGAMLSGQAAGAEKQGDEELRKVTVIFSDLSGFAARGSEPETCHFSLAQHAALTPKRVTPEELDH